MTEMSVLRRPIHQRVSRGVGCVCIIAVAIRFNNSGFIPSPHVIAFPPSRFNSASSCDHSHVRASRYVTSDRAASESDERLELHRQRKVKVQKRKDISG